MPIVRIDLSNTHSAEVVQAIGDVIYDAMVSVASVPADDRFQIVSRHADDELIYPRQGYLGVTYTKSIVFIQVTWNAGRTIEVKQGFYRAVADGIHARTGIRKEDVWISLVDVNRVDWSFGNGEMQYAPPP
ncbi:tautomerase family protein [Cupriavidus sp. 30B13]|uniref:tautomerase family protein n=1 Tax=Cupriavidus sp. 30B13 TaxID=3384241 RepID=UPI003B913979